MYAVNRMLGRAYIHFNSYCFSLEKGVEYGAVGVRKKYVLARFFHSYHTVICYSGPISILCNSLVAECVMFDRVFSYNCGNIRVL